MRKVCTTSIFFLLISSGLACSNSGGSANTASSNNIVQQAIAAILPTTAVPAGNRQAGASSPLNGTQRSPIYQDVGATYANMYGK